MKTVEVTIGNKPLKSIERLLNDKEADAFKFVGSLVRFVNGELKNRVTFEELDAEADILPKLVVQEGMAPASDNVEPEWDGVLLTDKGLTFVSIHR